MSDVSKTNELIEKAREATACRCVDAPEIECGNHGDDHSRMVADLADALEAATRVPVQGEPNDELIEYALDYIENVCMFNFS